jgi:hypothetical protein
MSLAIKFCTKCVAACFQDVFGSKNGFQGQNNVQNGSKQSGDVPRVFVKCVGVGVGVGLGVGVGVGVGRVKHRLKRGWRSLIFFVNFDVVTVRKVNLQFVGQ